MVYNMKQNWKIIFCAIFYFISNECSAITLGQERVQELCREARILEKHGKKPDEILEIIMSDDFMGISLRDSKDRLLMKTLLEKFLVNERETTKMANFDGSRGLVIKEKVKNKKGSRSDIVNFFGMDSGQIQSNGGIQEVQSDDKVFNSKLSKSIVLNSVSTRKSSSGEMSKKNESIPETDLTRGDSSNGSTIEEKETFFQNRIKKCDSIFLPAKMRSDVPEQWMDSVAFIEKIIK